MKAHSLYSLDKIDIERLASPQYFESENSINPENIS
jgi:hypothetical protein